MISSVNSSMTQQLSYMNQVNQGTSVKNTREGSASEEASETTAQELAETSSKSSNRIDVYA
ncbi:MAG: hypothetical protein QMB62_03970 [Oscillospiraceae bacterium]